MKRLFMFVLAMLTVLNMVACNGNYFEVDVSKPIAIPQNGIVEQEVLEKIRTSSAIATFTGKSGDLQYSWTVFGNQITEAKDVNLSVEIKKVEGGVAVTYKGELGFSAMLSVTLDEKWNALTATAYCGEKVELAVSLTGSEKTILNLAMDGYSKELIIRPDLLSEDNTTSGTTESTEGDTTKPSEGKDQYLTDPIPEGKPKPVEPENQDINKENTYTCTFSIECSTILNNLDQLESDKLEVVPPDGVIFAQTTVVFYEGESVLDVLQRLCKEKGIHMEASWTPIYNSAYVEGSHNLYEFDCGSLSGWMYRVNGWYPNYGSSRYQLKQGDIVEWRFTCDLGKDVGCYWMAGS